MKPFTTNLALKDSLDSRKEHTDFKSEVLPKEIQDKLKLLESVQMNYCLFCTFGGHKMHVHC